MRTAEAGMGQAGQGSGAPQPNQPAQPAQKRGSGWTNLKAYVGANQGEGERMAGDIGSQAAEQATGNVSQIASEGQKQIEGLDQYQPKTTTAAYFADPTKIKAGIFNPTTSNRQILRFMTAQRINRCSKTGSKKLMQLEAKAVVLLWRVNISAKTRLIMALVRVVWMPF